MAEDAGPAPDPVWRDIRFSRPLRRACPVRLPTCCYIESPPPSVRDGRAESKSRVARDEDWSGTSVLPRVSPGSKPGGFLSSSCPRNRWRSRRVPPPLSPARQAGESAVPLRDHWWMGQELHLQSRRAARLQRAGFRCFPTHPGIGTSAPIRTEIDGFGDRHVSVTPRM